MKRSFNINYLILFVVIFIATTGCTGLKFVPAGEKLYTTPTVKIITTEKVKKPKKYKKLVQSVIRPKANKKILWMRPKLWFYYVSGDTTGKKKFRKWVKKKLGEPPVYASAINPSLTLKYIDAAMFNQGIFKASSIYSIKEGSKTENITYTVSIHNPFTIDSISYPSLSGDLEKILITSSSKTLLKKNTPYSLALIKKERSRIDQFLKEKGFFYFRPDYLKFIADTNEVKNTVNLDLQIDDEIPDRAKRIYKIGTLTIDQSYSLKQDTVEANKDTIMVNDVVFKKPEIIKPKVILRSVFLKKNEIYSRQNHGMTLSRLMNIGNFKFITIDFPETDSSGIGILNVNINLTPTAKRTARIEVLGTTKSNDFLGPALNLSFKNRNSFDGAELLTVNFSGRFETQLNGKFKGLYSYDFGPNVEFTVPRFLVPFRMKEPKGYYTPLTKFSLGYKYMKRVGFYTLLSLDFSFGYKWRENLKIEHELNPLFINYAVIRDKSVEFDSLLNSNIILKGSFEEQLIEGLNYSFTYNEQVIPEKKNQIFFQLKSEFAGNALSLFDKMTSSSRNSSEEPLKILGTTYSQYGRLSLDLRNYLIINGYEKLVLRFFSGLGLPYGNSDVLPYSKQFFSGGPNSIRAFRWNTLGPGTFHTEETIDGNLFFNQGGEIKFETNAEYRFTIYKLIKGAFFTDAGNIWLIHANTEVNSEPFRFSRLFNESAVGSGFGIRLDATFFVVRFDLAFPLRKPWITDGSKWVINTIAFGNSSWRKDNLLFNFAIGYPF